MHIYIELNLCTNSRFGAKLCSNPWHFFSKMFKFGGYSLEILTKYLKYLLIFEFENVTHFKHKTAVQIGTGYALYHQKMFNKMLESTQNLLKHPTRSCDTFWMH